MKRTALLTADNSFAFSSGATSFLLIQFKFDFKPKMPYFVGWHCQKELQNIQSNLETKRADISLGTGHDFRALFCVKPRGCLLRMGSHLVCKVILVLFTIIFISEFVVEELFRCLVKCWISFKQFQSVVGAVGLVAGDLFSYYALALQDLMFSVNSIAKIVQFYPGKQGKILLSFFKHFASSCKNSSRNSCEI